MATFRKQSSHNTVIESVRCILKKTASIPFDATQDKNLESSESLSIEKWWKN